MGDRPNIVLVHGAWADGAAAGVNEPEVHEDYVSAYDLGRLAESARSCGVGLPHRAPVAQLNSAA